MSFRAAYMAVRSPIWTLYISRIQNLSVSRMHALRAVGQIEICLLTERWRPLAATEGAFFIIGKSSTVFEIFELSI